RGDAHLRAHHYAEHHRCAVEGPPVITRSPETGHRSCRLRAEGSSRRIQEAEFLSFPGAARSYRHHSDPIALQSPGRRGATAGGTTATSRATSSVNFHWAKSRRS